MPHHRISQRGRSLALATAIIALTPLLGACGGNRRDAGSAPKSSARDSAAIVILDAQGEEVRLAHPARRVISLAPNITETIFALGAGSTLIGRTTYCDYPPEALKVPPMGDMLSLNYEAIVSAKPDLIVMTHVGNIKSNYEKLRELGLAACTVGAENIDGILGIIDTLGILLGRRPEATALRQRLVRELDSIGALTAKAPKVSTFIVVDRTPLITAGGGFLIEELNRAGGDNIAKEGVTTYPKYSREELLRRDPEVILIPGDSMGVVNDLLATYPEWRRLRAVRENHVYVMPPGTIFRPGPRFTRSIGLLYQALHGGDPKALLEEAKRQ